MYIEHVEQNSVRILVHTRAEKFLRETCNENLLGIVIRFTVNVPPLVPYRGKNTLQREEGRQEYNLHTLLFPGGTSSMAVI